MSESNNETQLVKYYENACLPDEKIDAMLATAQLARDARRWRQIAFATAASLIVVAAFGGWQFVRNAQLREQLANQPNDQVTPGASDDDLPQLVDLEEEEQLQTLPTPRYHFVAFRSHSDGCAACRVTGELYAKLKENMADRPVEFEQFELQKREQLERTNARIDELNLTSHVAGKSETAFALLLSPTGVPIQRIDPTDDLSAIQALTESIVDQ